MQDANARLEASEGRDALQAACWAGQLGTARLLLRSMGYRDALIGAMLLSSAVRGRDTRGWFLASGGADASDLLGGWSVHDQMRPSQKLIGLGGAVLGIGVGLWGATRPRAARSSPESGMACESRKS